MFGATPPRRTTRSSTRNDSDTLCRCSASSWSENLPGKCIRWSVAIEPATRTLTGRGYLTGGAEQADGRTRDQTCPAVGSYEEAVSPQPQNELPQAQPLEAFGLSIVKPCCSIVSVKSMVAPPRYGALIRSTTTGTPWGVSSTSPSRLRSSKKSWYCRPAHPPGWTAMRRRRSSRPSCSSSARTFTAAVSVSVTSEAGASAGAVVSSTEVSVLVIGTPKQIGSQIGSTGVVQVLSGNRGVPAAIPMVTTPQARHPPPPRHLGCAHDVHRAGVHALGAPPAGARERTSRSRVRAGRRLPGRAPARLGPDPRPPSRGGQGGARRAGLRPRPPLPARRSHPVRRRHGRFLQAGPGRRRTPAGRVHRLLRRPLHGRVGRHPDVAGAAGRP